jgi:hypothetical protein
MFFSNPRQIASINNNNNNNNIINMFHNQINRISINQGLINKHRHASSDIQSPAPIIKTQPTNPEKKSMKWGEPVWFLFHTLAYKVNENTFSIIRKDLINIIYTICSNLPCPDCAKHATQYMNSINFNSIQTKEQLKDMLFIFHNTVNKKKGFPIFPHDELDSKYSKANTLNIIKNFMVTFENKHKSIHMISDDMYRIRISNNLKIWFNANIQYFSL